MKPIFSVITVTYNASQWIERTIESVVLQSYPNIEYIVIDGNSTDGTVEIIMNYELRIMNYGSGNVQMKWISETDKGLYDAMNKGLKLASGDYVWFINAGDELYSDNTIQEIVNMIDTENLPDIIYGETKIVDEYGNSLAMRRLKAPEKLTWKSFNMGMLVCHQSFIVKREITELYDMKYRFTADYDWCIRCMKKAKTIYNIQLILSRFLEAGISAANRKESLKERYGIMCKNYGKLPTQIRHIWFAVRFYATKWTKKTVS
jgi:glycosyltransferase involved in cell wall biosynthesis